VRGKRYTSEGIVLARYRFSEADRLLIVYSKHYGKLSLIAKGVRKPESRKRGSLEVFSKFKFSAARGRSLDVLTEVDLLDGFSDIRNDLKKVALIYYFLEVVNKVTPGEDQNVKVYETLYDAIKSLRESSATKRVREAFIKDLLTELGFWPRGKKLDNADGVLADVVERDISSFEVGKKLLS
jgi:DNA repair protein RecO (recombination protein O)